MKLLDLDAKFGVISASVSQLYDHEHVRSGIRLLHSVEMFVAVCYDESAYLSLHKEPRCTKLHGPISHMRPRVDANCAHAINFINYMYF